MFALGTFFMRTFHSYWLSVIRNWCMYIEIKKILLYSSHFCCWFHPFCNLSIETDFNVMTMIMTSFVSSLLLLFWLQCHKNCFYQNIIQRMCTFYSKKQMSFMQCSGCGVFANCLSKQFVSKLMNKTEKMPFFTNEHTRWIYDLYAL